MNSLPLSVELKGVSSLPCFVSGTTDGLSESVTLAEASGLLAGRGEALELSVLVHWLGDPLHVWVSSDDLVHWVDHHDLVVLVALLGFVAQKSGLLWSRWSASSVDSWELSKVPRSKSEDVLHDIALLLSPKFVLVPM